MSDTPQELLAYRIDELGKNIAHAQESAGYAQTKAANCLKQVETWTAMRDEYKQALEILRQHE